MWILGLRGHLCSKPSPCLPMTLHTGHLSLFQRSTSPCPPSRRAAGQPPLRGIPYPKCREGPGKRCAIAAHETTRKVGGLGTPQPVTSQNRFPNDVGKKEAIIPRGKIVSETCRLSLSGKYSFFVVKWVIERMAHLRPELVIKENIKWQSGIWTFYVKTKR